MAGTPVFKVYDADGTYQASCKEPEACAALMSFYGIGATIRYGHGRTLWTEGETGRAAESYDIVASTVWSNLHALQAEAYAKIHKGQVKPFPAYQETL
jgi:hypothetical protein